MMIQRPRSALVRHARLALALCLTVVPLVARAELPDGSADGSAEEIPATAGGPDGAARRDATPSFDGDVVLKPVPPENEAHGDVAEATADTEPQASDLRHPVQKEAVDRELEVLLDKHRFCQADDYQLPLRENALCQFSEQAKKRCPGIEKACKNPFLHNDDSWHWDWLSLDDMAGVVAVVRALVWTLLIGALVFLVALLLRRVIASRASEEQEEPRGPTPPEEETASQLAAKETDVNRLLNRARQAAGRGDFAAGIRDAYAALLRKLDQDGLIEVHLSKTNGDYRRSLAPNPDIQREFAVVARTVEGVQFGSQLASADTFQRVIERVTPLVSKAAVLLLVLLGSFASLACEQLGQRPRASALGCGETPGGYSVMCELLSKHSASLKRRIRKVDKIDDVVSELVVLPEADLSEKEWGVIDEWVKGGHTLALAQLPEPAAQALDAKVKPERCQHESHLVSGWQEYYGPDTELETLRSWPYEIDQPVSWAVAECDTGPTLVGMSHGQGSVFLLPSAAFLSNLSLASADNAYLAVKLLSRPEQNIEVLGGWTGSGSSNPFEALSDAKLTPWLLQLLAVAVLLALWRGAHFGLPRDPTTKKRHAFVEHVRALGLQYARSKASRHVLSNYSSWALARLHDRMLPGSRASLSNLASALARLTGREERAVLQILIAAKSAQDEAHDNATPQEHLNTMRDLESLLKAAGGTR